MIITVIFATIGLLFNDAGKLIIGSILVFLAETFVGMIFIGMLLGLFK